MEEVWSDNFQRVKEFYEKNNHLTLPRNDPESVRLSNWLSHQRHRHRRKNLPKHQQERLDSIRFREVKNYRQHEEDIWKEKFEMLKLRLRGNNTDTKLRIDHSLSCWLSRQRRLYKCDKLQQSRKTLLSELGVFVATKERIKRTTQETPQQKAVLQEGRVCGVDK